jgi:hypothetical protein
MAQAVRGDLFNGTAFSQNGSGKASFLPVHAIAILVPLGYLLERDQEKWSPVFRPDRATSKRI